MPSAGEVAKVMLGINLMESNAGETSDRTDALLWLEMAGDMRKNLLTPILRDSTPEVVQEAMSLAGWEDYKAVPNPEGGVTIVEDGR